MLCLVEYRRKSVGRAGGGGVEWGGGRRILNPPGKGEVDFFAHIYFIGLSSEDLHI